VEIAFSSAGFCRLWKPEDAQTRAIQAHARDLRGEIFGACLHCSEETDPPRRQFL
jgi:hypothetical protein